MFCQSLPLTPIPGLGEGPQTPLGSELPPAGGKKGIKTKNIKTK